MVMDKVKACFESETYHEGENKILKVTVDKCPFPPSIEYSSTCMGKVIDLLNQNSGVTGGDPSLIETIALSATDNRQHTKNIQQIPAFFITGI